MHGLATEGAAREHLAMGGRRTDCAWHVQAVHRHSCSSRGTPWPACRRLANLNTWINSKAQWRRPPIASRPQALDPGYTDDEEESPHGQESHHQHDQNFGAPGAGHTRQPPAATNSCQLSPPAKRAAGLIGTEGNGDKRQRCDTSASAATATGPAGPAGAGGRTAALGGEVGFKANGLQTGCAATCEGTEEEELPLARQLRGFLCEAVWRWARPTTAQALLQVRVARRGEGLGEPVRRQERGLSGIWMSGQGGLGAVRTHGKPTGQCGCAL